MRRFPALIVPALVTIGVVAPPAALAGTFEVSACDAAPGFANNSWIPQTTQRGVLTFSQCPSGDDQQLGLIARHAISPSHRRAATGAATRWRFDAPPATTIVGIRANALFEQTDTRWQVGLFNNSTRLVGCSARRSPTGGSCVGAMSAGDYRPLPASSVIFTEVSCVFGPCPLGVRGQLGARASMTFARVSVEDVTQPVLGNVGGNLWTPSWVSGTRQLSFDASDNTGIKDVRASIDGAVRASSHRNCDPTVKTCPDWPGVTLSVATGSDIPDGRHTVSVQAVDKADNVGSQSRDVLIDNTPPAAPREVAVAGGESWKPAAVFKIAWKNPPQDFAPIAGVEYTLCPTPPAEGQCVRGTKDGEDATDLDGLQVPAPGDWTLTTWLRDAAGNAAPETAAAPVHLRFDPSPPQVAIRQTDPEDPSRVHVGTSDDLSGIARGEIDLRRRGTETWRQLDAAAEPGGFSANLHDERLKDGVYELRAHAWDGAGNERSSTQFEGGATALLTLPLRIKTQLRVGKALRLRPQRGRGAKRAARTVFVGRPLIRHGQRARLHGRLVAPGDNPIQGATISVAAKPDLPGADYQPVATLITSRTGRFTYMAPAGPSRLLQFAYAGAPKIRPKTRQVELRVRASSSLRTSRRSVVNGEAVTFGGRLIGGTIPRAGKLVELQYFDRGSWRTFRTIRAGVDGRWRYAYRFDGTRGVRHYRFRVAIPRESGYPFSTGSSSTVRVTVRGM